MAKNAVVELGLLNRRLGAFLHEWCQLKGFSAETKYNELCDWLPADSTIRDLVAGAFGPEWAGYLGDRLNRLYHYAYEYKDPGPQLGGDIEAMFRVATVQSAIRILLNRKKSARLGGKKSSRKRKRLPRTMPTERELEALELKSQGRSLQQIANTMGVSKSRAGQLLDSAKKRPEAPGRSIALAKAVPMMNHDGVAPKAKKKSRRPNHD